MEKIQLENYLDQFETILGQENPQPPYDSEDYINYTKLNYSRMKRWLANMELDEELAETIKGIKGKQHWIIITEPWCGDAAHSVPFLVRLAELNPGFTYELQYRDREPSLIESYLTNGTRGIPKLIVRNEAGEDLFTWGPRPAVAQELINSLKEKETSMEDGIMALQQWYNIDKGQSLQEEIKKELNELAKK